MTTGERLARDVIAESERIEREKCGRALTADEARTLAGAAFLRAVLPPSPGSTRTMGAAGGPGSSQNRG